MIEATMFDLGGVFFEDGSDKFLKVLGSKTGKPYKDLHKIFREGKSIEYRKNIISGKDFFAWAAKEVDSGLNPAQINEMWVSQYTEMKGMRKLIKDLKSKGVKTTILSDNVPERIEFLEKKYHFLRLFDDVVLSYEVNLTKSSPEMFRLALSRIDVKPEDVVFVDDRDKNILVAKKLGINTILFTNVKDLKKQLNSFLSYN